MAADSDGTLTAVVICEGDLSDPEFPRKFRSLLGKLNSILDPPKRKKRIIKVNKVCDFFFLKIFPIFLKIKNISEI